MSKKVIFIGGTSYSGSTLLDMILANDEKGFSLGEVKSYFYPTKKHHINPLCGCGNEDCNIPELINDIKLGNLYSKLFEKYPEIDFIIDSSKSPFWIYKQSKKLQKQGIDVKNVLIWKTPLELAKSFYKRGRGDIWKKKWIEYHKRYFSFIKNYKTVKYKDLVSDSNVLKELCEYLQIPFFIGKYNYWEKTHHTFFGNKSAKMHLYKNYNNKDEVISKIQRSYKFDNDENKQLGEIYYNQVNNPDFDIKVKKQIINDKDEFESIIKTLAENKTNSISPKLNFFGKNSYLVKAEFLLLYGRIYKLYYRK